MSRILAIDHGTVRIGLAISDDMRLVASPLRTLDARGEPEREIARIVQDRDIGTIVIGMPFHLSGEKGAAAKRTEAFGEKLSKALHHAVPVEYVDERLSSVEAEASLARAGITGRKERDEVIDQLAAVVILQDYLNSQRGPEGFLLPDEAFDLPWTDETTRQRRRRRGS